MNTSELSYYPELIKIREYLERRSSTFPEEHCIITSRLVQQQTGLLQVGGYYDFGTWKTEHYWNLDLMNLLFIDLTQDQFNKSLPAITIRPISRAPLELKINNTLRVMLESMDDHNFELFDGYSQGF